MSLTIVNDKKIVIHWKVSIHFDMQRLLKAEEEKLRCAREMNLLKMI